MAEFDTVNFWDDADGNDGDDDGAWESFGQSRVQKLEAEMKDMKPPAASSDESESGDDDSESEGEQESDSGFESNRLGHNPPSQTSEPRTSEANSAQPLRPEYTLDAVITFDHDAPPAEEGPGDRAFSAKFLDMLGVKTSKGRLMEYEVTFDRGPVGLRLETDWYGRKACVRGFTKINGEDGPAKKSGLVHIGDVLAGVNEKSVLDLPFREAMEVLKGVSAGQHTLTFKAAEAVGELGAYLPDREVTDARRYIHEQKERFYLPPEPTVEGGEHEIVYCCVERRRGADSLAFHLLREDTGEFLCAATVAADRTGKFIFHTLRDTHLRPVDRIPTNQDSAVYLGCLVPSLLGTTFTLYNHRPDPHTDLQTKQGRAAAVENELAYVSYETNVMGRVPNFMKVVVPRPARATEAAAARRGLEQRYKTFRRQRQLGHLGMKLKAEVEKVFNIESNEEIQDFNREYTAVEQDNQQDLMIFETKRPVWNEQIQAWTLNFNGRVKIPSKKNFLIQAELDNHIMESEFGEDVYLRFGKMTKSRFSLDFRHPLSPVVALAIAASSFADKMLVT
mmetsp:Transcript_1739/g.2910  ORF Transcript_1739/g.2910 Transcript_1739/m.2910 type:complete len:563 (+) Transcript_1739:56-1744(+)